MDLSEFVANRIKELRESRGLSQQALADGVKTTANTISRWETGTYKPSLNDLDELSRFLRVSVLEFMPERENGETRPKVQALLRAARQLPEKDIDELQRYAEFRQMRAHMRKPNRGRKAQRKSDE